MRLLPLVLLCCLLLTPGPWASGEEPSPAAEPLLPAAWVDAMPWRPLGPACMGGRITALAVHEADPTLYWAATASGGLLKTRDGGITFEHQFDREAVVSIGDVAVAPSDPRIVWVGTGECNPRNSVSWGNGVYKSADGGATWKHMGLDGSFQVGAVRIHPENPDVVYVGALGRLWGPNEARGLYKTTDGGTTWKRIRYLDEDTGVIDVQLHPRDPETLLVASYQRRRDEFDTNDPAVKWGPGSGLWKSTDGGASFARITEGLPSGATGRIGVEYYRKNPDHVYLVLESERIGQEPGNAAYMGITGEDADVGARLRSVVEKGPAAKAGLQQGDVIIAVDGETVHSYRDLLRRIRKHVAGDTVTLEVSRERKGVTLELALGARPKPKRAEEDAPPGSGRAGRARSPFGAFLGGQRENLQEEQGADGHEHGGVYRSTDGGESWTRINSLNPRPMYFSEIRVDPSDEQRIWVLGIRLWMSEDGGATFKPDGAPRDVHVDHHALWIDPRDGRHLILGNDGGVYVSRDRGKHFDHLNHVDIGQFYDVGVGPGRDYFVYGGLQDNGSWGGPSRVRHGSGPANSDWFRIGGGDGFRVRVDPHDAQRIYFESQNGNVGRRHLRTGEQAMFRPRPPKGSRYRFNWYTPFVLSHHNSRIYYTAGNHVFRSLDRGEGLRVLSPEITATDRGSATALAESPLDAERLWVGTDDGGLWTSHDGGHTWRDLYAAPEGATPPGEAEPPAEEAGGESDANGDTSDDPGVNGTEAEPEAPAPETGKEPAAPKPGPALRTLQPERRYVSWIECSRHVKERVYLVFDGHRSDDDRALVFASEDGGRSWRSLTANLPPAAGTTRVLREDLRNPDLLYLGTEFGAWVSLDRGGTWTRMHGKLPTVAVHQFAQPASCEELVAGTHGRSLWVLDVSALRQVTPAVRRKPVHLFQPDTAVQWRPEPRRGGGRTFRGRNPDSGAVLHVALAKDTPGAKLEIRTLDGQVLRTLDVPGTAGLQRVVWDLRKAPEGRRRVGARVRPGSYRVVLHASGQSQAVDLEVVMDPGHTDPAWMPHEDAAEERQAQRKAHKALRYQPYDQGRGE